MMIDEMVHKNRGHKIKSQKGKANRRNSIRGTQRFTKPSPTVDSAKVEINPETAIPLLDNLKQKYAGTCNPYGFINDLREALGIPKSKGSSKYGVVQIPRDDGILESSISITNHNATAENYITHGCNLPYNLRLLIRKKFQPNRFHPHKDVKLDEYVYYAKRMQKVENPLCQIIDSLINFLKTGQYKDTTGVAFLNQSPQQTENEQHLRKLKQIITESVRMVLNETKWIDGNDEPIDGPDYVSIDNLSQNNLPPIDRYHPDYWYYRQEEEPYDPTYDEGYLDDYTVNNDDEFKDDLDDWGIKENKQYNNMSKQKIYIKEDSLDDPQFPEAERKRYDTPKELKEKAVRKREQTCNYLEALVRGYFTSHKELGFKENKYLCGGECYYCSEAPYFGFGFAYQDDYPMYYTIEISGFKDDDYYLGLMKDLANSIIRRSDSLFKIDKAYKSDYDQYTLKMKMLFKDMITFGETNSKNENNTIKENRNMKQTTYLKESELKRMIAESVKKVMNEVEFNGQSYHGNIPYDWSRMAQLRDDLRVNAKRDAWDEQLAYNYSFDPRDREHYYEYKDAEKKHEKNRDRDWKNYEEMRDKKIDRIVSESIKRMLSESDEGMKQFIKMHKSSKAGFTNVQTVSY